MTTTSQYITAEQLLERYGNQRCELVKGEVRMMSPAGANHGSIINTLAFLLTAHVRQRSAGAVFTAETGFWLARNPDTVRGPDVAFVKASRIPAKGLPSGYWEGAPDLAVEVLSPSDTVENTEEKIDEYIAAGARLVWLVNPKRRTVTVYRPQSNPAILREADSLDGGDVVPGFSCRVSEIFA